MMEWRTFSLKTYEISTRGLILGYKATYFLRVGPLSHTGRLLSVGHLEAYVVLD